LLQGEEQYIRRVTVGSEGWSKINMEEQHCEDAKSLPEAQVEMVSDFLARWHISRMTEQDRQVTRPDIVLDVDHIAQTSNAREVQPAPAAFRLTAATATATDPRSSASTTYSTVFSGSCGRALHGYSYSCRSSVLCFHNAHIGQNMSAGRWRSARARGQGHAYCCRSSVL